MDDRIRHVVTLLQEAMEILLQLRGPSKGTRWEHILPSVIGALRVLVRNLEHRLEQTRSKEPWQ